MELLPTLLTAAAALITLVSAVVAGVYVGRDRSKDAAINALKEEVAAVRGTSNADRERHMAEQAECARKIEAQERQVAELRGRIDTMMTERTDVLAVAISDKMTPIVGDFLVEELAPRVVRGIARVWTGKDPIE